MRSKCYAYRSKLDGDGNIFKSICKGNSKNNIFKQCYNCIQNKPYNRECTQYCLRSHDQEMFQEKITKKSLSPFDDKRECRDKIISKPWSGL